ncbi:GNAT family N-acetyltransferase [Salaquimonas pukyongi]|uniref:GNAT family N-acetyltransferase n=1 Tax=Salaquimonas pukyongi TaxID=2712698 RepID=UPI00096B6D04|nr:N-acetyltransferase [Salaquimonas pukyongi]
MANSEVKSKPAIRESRPGDLAWLELLYPAAFPEEDLLPLVRAMLTSSAEILSLVAEREGAGAGHCLFTLGSIEGTGRKIALLGPVGVDPNHQRCGIGSAMIAEGLKRLQAAKVKQVFVLGDPSYYSRFGFRPGAGVKPPYELPQNWSDAWQTLPLGDGDVAEEGRLLLPEFWMRPELWAE